MCMMSSQTALVTQCLRCRVELACDVQDLCTSADVEDIIVVTKYHLDVWTVHHIHSVHTQIGFLAVCALLCLSLLSSNSIICCMYNMI